MYISRLYATNDIVSLEFDALNGEILALVREDTADNACKNYRFRSPMTPINNRIS